MVTPEPITQLLYTSTATAAMNEQQWLRIEEASSIYNALNGITGLCCFDGAGFMQLIEGRTDKVDQLLARIEADHCHADLTVHHRELAPFASYGDWAMRFCRTSSDQTLRFKELERLMAPSLSPELRDRMLSWGASAEG